MPYEYTEDEQVAYHYYCIKELGLKRKNVVPVEQLTETAMDWFLTRAIPYYVRETESSLRTL